MSETNEETVTITKKEYDRLVRSDAIARKSYSIDDAIRSGAILDALKSYSIDDAMQSLVDEDEE